MGEGLIQEPHPLTPEVPTPSVPPDGRGSGSGVGVGSAAGARRELSPHRASGLAREPPCSAQQGNQDEERVTDDSGISTSRTKK